MNTTVSFLLGDISHIKLLVAGKSQSLFSQRKPQHPNVHMFLWQRSPMKTNLLLSKAVKFHTIWNLRWDMLFLLATENPSIFTCKEASGRSWCCHHVVLLCFALKTYCCYVEHISLGNPEKHIVVYKGDVSYHTIL